MAPEQARGRAVDRRADIWAFGNVVYELLTGRRAFEGEDVADIVAKILEREPDWAALPPSTPPDLRRLLVRCLMKDPKARLRDIGEARVTIDALLRGETQTADSPSPFAPPGRGTVLLPWTIAAALAVVVAFFFIQRARPSSPSQVAHVDISLPADVEVYNGPSISADGTTIVFVGVRGSTRQVLAVDMTTTPASRTCCSTSTSASARASRLRATASVTTAASS